VNGRKSNFTEVTELLKAKGVDLDNNRFLILQVNALSCLFSVVLYAAGGRISLRLIVNGLT
jgi:hypothetical protein